MTNKYKNKGIILAIIFLACLCFVSSCTYDYFEDETNYAVYVPKADKNKKINEEYGVDRFKLFIYKNDLVRETDAIKPFDTNPRTQVGNYHYKLFPGTHRVYCFTNISDYEILESQSITTARFNLLKDQDNFFEEPKRIKVDYKEPNIVIPSRSKIDTAYLEHNLVGRICFAFKNANLLNSGLTFDNIKRVDIIAQNVGTVQYFKQIKDSINTRSSRLTVNDEMALSATMINNPYLGYQFGFENYYLPSLDENVNPDITMHFELSFIDNSNNLIFQMGVDARDGFSKPAILHMNQTLLITIDGNNVQVLELNKPLDWNPNIQPGGETSPGSGGIEL